MGWWSKKSETDRSQPSQELVAQDPRTRVQTTSAATETTNTAVQNSTITDNNKQTVTFLTTRQTVTHTQRALITETTTRRTPSQAELEALFAKIKMGGEGPIGSTTTTTAQLRNLARHGREDLRMGTISGKPVDYHQHLKRILEPTDANTVTIGYEQNG